MQKITTFLTFKDQAEEAATFYTTVFADATISQVSRFGAGMPLPAGTVMSVSFKLYGQAFVALNSGDYFTFGNGVSFLVDCKSQAELDTLWDKLTDGGKEGQCGWLTDKFGVSWQLAPASLGHLLQDADPAKSKRVMDAMVQMTKIDMQALEEAYNA